MNDTRYASEGAVNQGGSRPIRKCNKCAAEIVLVKSDKTGKFYPVSVSNGRSGMAFYIKSNLHKCDEVLLETALFELEIQTKKRYDELVALENEAIRVNDRNLEDSYRAERKKLWADYEAAKAELEKGAR